MYNLSDIQEHEPGWIDVLLTHRFFQIEDRISRGIVSETKGAPLGRNEIFCTQISERINCFSRIDMSVMHEPAGMIER